MSKIKRTYAPEKYREWWMKHWDLFVALHSNHFFVSTDIESMPFKNILSV